MSGALEERRRRVAELAADPSTARYAPLVERGEDWSDENIAYYEDRAATVTCEHLAAIGGEMRMAGVETRRYGPVAATARCRIDLPRLQEAHDVSPPVRYAEFTYGERDDREYEAAHLICDRHRSMIHTTHPGRYDAADSP